MSEWNPQMVWNVVVGSTNLVILLGLVLLFWRQRNASRPKTTAFTGTGTFCGHCGKRLKSDPALAVAVAHQSYFVYKCPACNGETLLPTQSAG
jgi:hypothetical protein